MILVEVTVRRLEFGSKNLQFLIIYIANKKSCAINQFRKEKRGEKEYFEEILIKHLGILVLYQYLLTVGRFPRVYGKEVRKFLSVDRGAMMILIGNRRE